MSENPRPLSKRMLFYLPYFLISAVCVPAAVLRGGMGISELITPWAIVLWLFFSIGLTMPMAAVFSRPDKRPRVLEYVFGLIFGLCNVLCVWLNDTGSLSVLDTAGGCLRLLLRGVLQGFIATVVLAAFVRLLEIDSRRTLRTKPRVKHMTLWLTVLLLVCWSPYLLIYWPGTVNWDVALCYATIEGARQGTVTSSPAVPLVWHVLVTIGRSFGSENHGIGAYTCLQSAFLAWALASCVTRAREKGICGFGCFIMTAFFAVCPLFPGYAQFACSDTPFAAAITLIVVQLSRLTDRNAEARRPWLDAAVLFIALTVACVNRVTNAMPFVMALVALIGIAVIAITVCRPKQGLPSVAAAVLCAAVCAIWSFGVLPGMQVVGQEDTAIAATLYQTTARILRDAPEAVSTEDSAAIAAVFRHPDELGTLYDANICDPVKYDTLRYGNLTVDEDAETAFRAAALGMIRKAPRVALEAVLSGTMNYYAIVPPVTVPSYNDQAGKRIEFTTYDVSPDPRALHTVHSFASDELRQKLSDFALGWMKIDVLQLTFMPAVYFWAAAAAVLAFLRQKKARKLWLLVPLVPVLGVCLLSQVNDYMRYFFPIVCAVPLLLCEAKKTGENTIRKLRQKT